MGRVFWVVTALVLGFAVHLATVLYLPGLTFQRSLARATTGASTNHFFVMAPERQSAMVPTASVQDIVGVCLLNLSKGSVVISAQVPRRLWNFAIYSASGQQAYGINDVQADGGSFTVDVSKSKSLLQQLTTKPEAEDASQIANVGWHAEISEANGIALLWVPVPDASQRPQLEKIIAQTTCHRK